MKMRNCLWMGLLLTLGGCQNPPPARQKLSPDPPEGSAAAEPVTLPVEPTSKNFAMTPPVIEAAPPVPAAPTAIPAKDPGCADTPTAAEAAKMYPWSRRAASYESWCARFPAPAGYTRVPAVKDSYAWWLRHLPALAAGTPVKDYTGTTLLSATVISVAVIDLDVGTQDLQQCMDTIIRLRGEYHWYRDSADSVKFRYAGGLYYGFFDWRQGLRPEKVGGRIQLVARATAAGGRKSFEKYLRFMYAMTGTAHNTQELPVTAATLAPGDFFIEPSPSPRQLGHALIVLDVARDARGGLSAIIAQGYTPARDLHLLKSPDGSAWFTLDPAGANSFPTWGNPFSWTQVMRFRH